MEYYEWLSVIFSVIGIVIFLFAIQYENKIIKLLDRIKKAKKWEILRIFTIFFLCGYLVNIIGLSLQLMDLINIFNACVYLGGAVFVIMIVYISFNTYNVIFAQAEADLGTDLNLKDEK